MGVGLAENAPMLSAGMARQLLAPDDGTVECVWVDDELSAAHAEAEVSMGYPRREAQGKGFGGERLDGKIQNGGAGPRMEYGAQGSNN